MKDKWVDIMFANGVRLHLREDRARELGLLPDEESKKARRKMLAQVENKMLGMANNKGMTPHPNLSPRTGRGNEAGAK